MLSCMLVTCSIRSTQQVCNREGSMATTNLTNIETD